MFAALLTCLLACGARTPAEVPPAAPAEIPPEPAAPEATLTRLRTPAGHAAGDRVLLKVEAGKLEDGQSVVIEAADGRVLGAVSPFGHQQRQGGYAVKLAVEPELLSDGELEVRAVLVEGETRRPATEVELTGMSLVVE